MILKRGRYGPYLQLGEQGEGRKEKPKRISLPPGVQASEVTPQLAAQLLSLPRPVGDHPESGNVIEASIGPYGPYVRHGRTYASLGKEDDVLEVGLERALELLAKKRGRGRGEPLKTLGNHPESGDPVELHNGRFGPYVKHGKVNASLPRGQEPDTVSMDQALELLAAREAKLAAEGKSPRGKRSRKTAGKGKATAKKKSSARKKSSGPKATLEDLRPYLD